MALADVIVSTDEIREYKDNGQFKWGTADWDLNTGTYLFLCMAWGSCPSRPA